jgi:hypothetical protein
MENKEKLMKNIIRQRAKDKCLKEKFIFESEQSIEDMLKTAKTVEDNTEVITQTVMKPSYVDVIRKNTRRNNSDQTTRAQNYQNKPRVYHQEKFLELPVNQQRQQNFTRQVVSLKDQAKLLYCEKRGLQKPQIKKLGPRSCFCCGNDNHQIKNCSLKDKCVYCRKPGHSFKKCYKLLGTLRNKSHVASLVEENWTNNQVLKDNCHGDLGNNISEIPYRELEINPTYHEVTLNGRGSIASISSVESQ